MHKLSCVCLFLVLALASASTGRSLKQGGASASSSASATSTDGGSASASANAVSTGGTATAVAEATSEAFTEVENSFVAFFEKILIDLDFPEASCVDLFKLFEIDLVSVARVAATAYTTALADVSVEGDGEACANANASAEAQATGFARLIIDALIKVRNGPSVAEAEAAVDLFIDAFVRAFSESFASACAGSDSAAFAFQETFAEAVASPIAGVVIFLKVGLDCGDAFAEVAGEAFAEIQQTTVVDTTSIADAEGDADADATGSGEATVAERCRMMYSVCCSRNFNNRNSCPCTLSNRPSSARCDAVRTNSNPTEWYDEAANVRCFC